MLGLVVVELEFADVWVAISCTAYQLLHVWLHMTILGLEFKPDLEQEVEACMLRQLYHELAPVLISPLA